VGDFTLPGTFLQIVVGVLLCCGYIYLCVGAFTSVCLQIVVGVLLCCGYIYLCVGAFTSAWAILHCQECFCKLLWVYLPLCGRIYLPVSVSTLPNAGVCLLTDWKRWYLGS
jgi:uncharacterized membrane protein HdeD (DUF308 family)